jgi:hypothetical protein
MAGLCPTVSQHGRISRRFNSFIFILGKLGALVDHAQRRTHMEFIRDVLLMMVDFFYILFYMPLH